MKRWYKALVDVPDDSYVAAVHAKTIDNNFTIADRPAIEFELMDKEDSNGWDLASHIMHKMTPKEVEECFDGKYKTQVLRDLTYETAKKKYEKWDAKRLAVGDEIVVTGHSKGIITRVPTEEHWGYVMFQDGNTGYLHKLNSFSYYKKTGRHFPEMKTILEQIGDDVNDD